MLMFSKNSIAEIDTEKVECCYNRYTKMWKQLWNLVIGRGWKAFEVHTRKSSHCLEKITKVILVRTQNEKRRAVDRALMFFDNG